VFHPAHQVGNITNYSSTNQINDYQGINALSGKNLSEHIELQNRSDHVASVRVNETGPQSRAVAATRSESHEDRMLMSTETTATKSAADMQSEEATSSNDEAAHGKNHDSDPSRHHGDQSGHDGDALSASELPVNKLLSFALDSSCDVSKATLNVAIQSYVGSEHWGREVRQKIVWMFGLGHQSATLTLNPPNLGPLHISVKMQNNVAHTTFRSDDPSVREALAQGLVQLKEMMSKRGLVLGNTSLTNIGDEVLEND
jgi:flagellar hook-length control protein FliK